MTSRRDHQHKAETETKPILQKIGLETFITGIHVYALYRTVLMSVFYVAVYSCKHVSRKLNKLPFPRDRVLFYTMVCIDILVTPEASHFDRVEVRTHSAPTLRHILTWNHQSICMNNLYKRIYIIKLIEKPHE